MNKIPAKLRSDMGNQIFYGRCCLTGQGTIGSQANRFNADRIEWHHNLIYAGRQVQEAFAILPILKKLHDRVTDQDIRTRCDWIMLNRATDEELDRYSKVDNLRAKRDKLNERYGAWSEGVYPLNPNTTAYGG